MTSKFKAKSLLFALVMLLGLVILTVQATVSKPSTVLANPGCQPEPICPEPYYPRGWPHCDCTLDPPPTPPSPPIHTPTPTPVPTLAPKGIGLTYMHCEDVGSVDAAWQYDWTFKPKNCANVENVPMIWGRVAAEGLLNGTKILGGNSEYILGFNEPDLDGQANLTPQEAADLWYQLEIWVDQNHPGKKLVAPVPSHHDKNWLIRFHNAYENTYNKPPRLDALATHCYAWPGYFGEDWMDCQDDIEWYEARVDEWNIPGGIWVTEYGFPANSCSGLNCNWTPGVNALNNYTNWLQTRPKVKRYAWFTARIAGPEWWWVSPLYTTRLIQCSDHPNINCNPGQLSPFGAAYKAQ